MRISIIPALIVALLASNAKALYAASPKLAANDVTWLWPPPATPEDLNHIISIDSLTSSSGDPVWADIHFDDLIKVADSDHASVDKNRIGLPDSVRSKSVWRIAAFRVDPTAPGGHEVIRSKFGERPQIRLILQPVTQEGGNLTVHDIAAHMVYTFMESEDPTKPDREHFQQIVRDLDELKELVERAGESTSGKPLGIHPGLQARIPGLNEKVEDFLKKYLRAQNLTAMAIMGLDAPEPWIFVPLAKPKGGDHFGPIPFLPAEMISFRTRRGVVLPTPKVNNLNPVASGLQMPAVDSERRGVSTSVLFSQPPLDLDALAIVSKDQDGNPVMDEAIRNRDIPDIVADPIRSHFFNTDCVSCHTETRRRMRLGIAPGEFAFRQDGSPPAIDESVLPKDDWNVRNIGWFPPRRPIGGGPTVATVTQRTANETAEVVDFIERHYRHEPSPGPGGSSSDTTAPGHTDPSAKVQYLEQGWNDEQRLEFYFVGQGSQLVPYSWFLALERAESEELLRSDRYMAALGFIPHAQDEHRNPDGLPIGFVKDSNPSTINQKAGFLGKNFNPEHYPGNDWLGFTCAACHTANLTYEGKTLRVDGGAALADVEQFLASLAASMRATVQSEEKFERFRKRIEKNAPGDIDTSGLRDQLNSYTPVIEELVARNDAEHPYGLGRLDAFGAILNQICDAGLGIPENRRPSSAPVSYPFLWDTPHFDWVQWNSSADIPISRNVGEVLGVFAHTRLTSDPPEEQFDTSARIDWLHHLETQLRELKAPVWPAEVLGAIDQEKADAGKQLFAENCAACHNTRDDQGQFATTDPNETGARFIKTTNIPFNVIGTDPQMVLNFVTRVAKPGDLKDTIAPEMVGSEAVAQQQRITALRQRLNMPAPDFTQEVPAGLLLRAAVRGVIAKDLRDRFEHVTDEERQQMLLDLQGGRGAAGSPPNGGAGYKARPLNGVWATAPYGHAGSVPNLYQWLLPDGERVKSFFVGSREFDPKHVGLSTEMVEGAFEFRTQLADGAPIPGNSNKGHSGPGHTDFTDEQRWQLIEYLKTLR
ncbi:di-heme-cytochrome C peroxidase [Lacipirellula sp.]|uniref:di-heme-cytochrome C peroxidase n=1 Tax=Lacipirellula sp. TaxID=2691419 RepID=UPI003D1079AE